MVTKYGFLTLNIMSNRNIKNNYSQVEDFLSDESFVSWVYEINSKDVQEWDLWMDEKPGNIEIAKEAVTILNLLKIKETVVSKEKIDKEETKLRFAIKDKSQSAKVIKFRRKRFWYWSAAAAIIISLGLGAFFYSHSSIKSQYATNYGEIEKNVLPDGTEVILNANSKLIFNEKWREGRDREVWIKGEAFFHVKKTPEHNRFIVHTDAFDIEVTGTSFNVINEDGKSSVILKEGSVKIHRTGENDILMKPGDVVVYNDHQIEKKKVQKQDYLAWTDNKLVFDNTPISEVAKTIAKHYGIEVNLGDDDIGKKTITGIMPNDNLDVLLQSLNATQEFKVLRTNNSITITEIK